MGSYLFACHNSTLCFIAGDHKHPLMDPADLGDDIDRRDETAGVDELERPVLYPIFETHETDTFELARAIAAGADTELIVLDFVEDTSSIADEAHTVGKRLLRSHLDEGRDVTVRSRIEETTEPVGTVTDLARLYDVRLIVFDRHTPDSLVGSIRGDVADRVSDRVPCDVVTVERSRNEHPSSILVPVGGGPHSPLAVTVAGALATGSDAAVDLLHVSTATDGDRADELFAAALDRLPEDVAVDTRSMQRSAVADAIVEQSANYDVTVLGEPQKSVLRRFVLGSTIDEVSEHAENTVLVCRRSDDPSFDLLP